MKNLHNQKQNSLPLTLHLRLGWAPRALKGSALFFRRLQGQPLHLQSGFTGYGKKTGKTETISEYMPLSFFWLLRQGSRNEGLGLQYRENRVKPNQWLPQSVLKVNLLVQHTMRFNRYNAYSTTEVRHDAKAVSGNASVFRTPSFIGVTPLTQQERVEVSQIAHLQSSFMVRETLSKSIPFMARQQAQHERIQKAIVRPLSLRQVTKNNQPPYRSHAPASRNAGALPDEFPRRSLGTRRILGGVFSKTRLKVLHSAQSTRTETPATEATVAKTAKPERVFRSLQSVREQSIDESGFKVQSASKKPQSVNVVERLFELGMASEPMQGLSLRDISQSDRAIIDAIEKKVTQSVSTLTNKPITMNTQEINQIADKVSRVLQQRERFERERRGQF